GLLAPEDAASIDTPLAIRFYETRSVAQQAPGDSMIQCGIDRRNRVTRSQRNELLAARDHQRIAHHDQAAGPFSDECQELNVNLASVSDRKHQQLVSKRSGRPLDLSNVTSGTGI